ncbi:MAG: apolipoprotein N-acyltransferase [Gammaproteobacteria bacterium]|nr:apolipoprotein N-acyltransferase [Gammaproteobacteria bacterium]
MRLPAASDAPGRLAAAAAGAVLPLAFAPFGWYPVALVSLAVLFVTWACRPREAAWRGFAYGAAAFVTGTWWLYISVRLVGGTPLPVAWLLLGGLVAIMAAHLAAAGWLTARLRSRSVAMANLLLAPGAWLLAEWLRGWILTGFPWLSIGYGQIDGPLAAWAPLGGVYGVSLVTAVLAGALVTLWRGSRRERLAAAAVALAIGAATAGLDRVRWVEPAGQPLQVSLVQGAVPQLLKWAPGERRATMDRYQAMTTSLGGDLVVWPEAAVPAPDDLVAGYLDGLRSLARERGFQLLVGILTHDAARDEYRNSLLALGAQAGAYHKRHLVPFGEFFPVPDAIRRWMRMMNLPYADLARGGRVQPPLMVRDVALAPTICYEDAYGAEQLGFLPAAGLLVNVSNDAWFGDTLAPHQHLQIARMRALETGRWMARSTNTGITAFIDERGRIQAQAPTFESFVLSGRVQPFAGATPYVSTGNLPVLLVALLAIVVAAAPGISRRR